MVSTLLAIIATYGFLIRECIVGGVYEQNGIVKKCPCRYNLTAELATITSNEDSIGFY